MRVETYSDRYFQDILNLVEHFHEEAVSEYAGFPEPVVLADAIRNADPGNSFLMLEDGRCEGILYGVRSLFPSNGKKVFQEVIWYVNKSHRLNGVRLLREVEKILKSQGTEIIIMAVLENSKTEKIKSFYERVGYKPMETHYVRSL
jgi:GNAT superfamily N-acetyltransferase